MAQPVRSVRGRWGALAPLCLLLSACRSAEVATLNLDELMDANDRFRYTARVTTGIKYVFGQLIDPSWLSEDSLLRSDGEEQPIPDPTGQALKNLLTLRGGAYSSNEWLHAEQVRQYVRYAVGCPAALCRERSYLELAEHALRLGPLTPVREPETAANAAEIEEALSSLVDALTAMIEAGGRIDETRRTDFEAACALCERLTLDVDGGWRLLKIVARFGEVSRVPKAELEPLFVLSRKVQADLVGQALAIGRRDPAPRARAAAWRANHAAYGERFLAEALLALTLPSRTEDGARPITQAFALVPEPPGHDEPALAALELVRDGGLPVPRELGETSRMELRLQELFVLVQITHDFSAYSDRVRTAAMRALGRVSGAGFESLRKEDWELWWDEYRPAERERIHEAAQRASAGGGS